MPGPLLEILIIFLLILVNGLLAMSEIAIVSARQNRLKARAQIDFADARLVVQTSLYRRDRDPCRRLIGIAVDSAT